MRTVVALTSLFLFGVTDAVTSAEAVKHELRIVETHSVDLNANGKPDLLELLVPDNWGDPGDYTDIRITLDSGEVLGISDFLGVEFEPGIWGAAGSEEGKFAKSLIDSRRVAVVPIGNGRVLQVYTEWQFASSPGRLLVVEVLGATLQHRFEDRVEIRSLTVDHETGKVRMKVQPCYQAHDTFYEYVSIDVYDFVSHTWEKFDLNEDASQDATTDIMGVYGGPDCGGEYLAVAIRAGERVLLPIGQAWAAYQRGELEIAPVKIK